MEENPEHLIEKAQKCLEPSFFKSMFSNASDRIEKAINYYQEAAEKLKLNKEWSRAGDCYIELSKLNEQINESPIESYDNAILCYNKCGEKEKYEKLNDKLISLYIKDGRFSRAAELTFQKGKNLLITANGDPQKISEVLEIYDKSLDFYEMDKDSNKNTISKIKEAKADLITLNGIKDELDQAKFIYEELAAKNNKSNFSKPFSIDYYGKCIFLLLAYDDYVTAKAYINKYYEESSSFYGSPIATFLENLILCMENNGKDIEDKTIGTENKVLNFDVAVLLYKKQINYNKKIWDEWKEIMVKKIGEKINQLKNESEEIYDQFDYK